MIRELGFSLRVGRTSSVFFLLAAADFFFQEGTRDCVTLTAISLKPLT